MKKILKILILINLFAIILVPNIVSADYAADHPEEYLDEWKGERPDEETEKAWEQDIVDQDIEDKVQDRDTGLGLGNLDKYKGSGTNSDKFKNKVNNILVIVRTIGIIISVIALALIGIKYMVGSVEERAEYKKTMIPYLIGVFLVFSVTIIPQLIYSIVNDL